MSPAFSHLQQELVVLLEKLIHELRDFHANDKGVHDARKNIKKARAILRILRTPLGEVRYRHENTMLRDAGRCLAPLRNAKALAVTLADFRERFAIALPPADFDVLCRRVDANLRAKRLAFKQATNALRTCKRGIRASRLRLRKWNQVKPQGNEIADGLRRVYVAGRKSLAEAKQKGTPEALHEWRKQVKYLSNALLALKVSDTHLNEIETQTGKLADQLGEDHDLVQLADYASNEAKLASPAKKSMLKFIERRRATLQKRVFRLGARTYDDKPARFAARLNRGKGTNRSGSDSKARTGK